ncbi:MAG: hypothetical protein WDN75_14150 [Bacteroidota bacterium]
MIPLLQITTEPTRLSILELLMKGGPVMVPIVLLSMLSVYILAERYLYLRNAAVFNIINRQVFKNSF